MSHLGIKDTREDDLSPPQHVHEIIVFKGSDKATQAAALVASGGPTTSVFSPGSEVTLGPEQINLKNVCSIELRSFSWKDYRKSLSAGPWVYNYVILQVDGLMGARINNASNNKYINLNNVFIPIKIAYSDASCIHYQLHEQFSDGIHLVEHSQNVFNLMSLRLTLLLPDGTSTPLPFSLCGMDDTMTVWQYGEAVIMLRIYYRNTDNSLRQTMFTKNPIAPSRFWH